MSTVHVHEFEDARGDLVDVEYFHHDCAGDNDRAYPAPPPLDYPVWCALCGERIWEVPLTDAGVEYCRENGIPAPSHDCACCSMSDYLVRGLQMEWVCTYCDGTRICCRN